MKKLIAPALILLVVYFAFIKDATFNKDFNFNGEIYSHVKVMSNRNMLGNLHVYTVNGEDINTAENSIQIIEHNEDIPKSEWASFYKNLFKQFKLVPVKDEQLELAGTSKLSGILIDSYAAPVEIEGKDYMAIYIATAEDKEKEYSISQKMDIIRELKRIEFN